MIFSLPRWFAKVLLVSDLVGQGRRTILQMLLFLDLNSLIKRAFQMQKIAIFYKCEIVLNNTETQQSIDILNVRVALLYYCAFVFGTDIRNDLSANFSQSLRLECA